MKRISLIYLVWATLLILGLLFSSIHAAETIKVAAIFAKTGDAATPNLMYFYSTRLAVEEINKKGGLLGKPIELIEIDNQSTALGSKAAAKHAVKNGVTAVIGGSRSSYALAMAPVLQAAKIPMISPTATIPELTGVGDYIFRACFVDDLQGAAMATFAIRDLKAKTAMVLTNTGNKYSMDLAKTFIRQFTQQGGTILLEGDYLMGSTDLVEMLSRVKAMHPDVIFLPGYVDDSAQIIKLARDKGIRVPILGGDGWDNLMYKTAGSALHGCYYTAQWHKDSTNEKSTQFVKSWEKTRGKVESQWIAPAYDAVMLLADAVRRAGALEPVKIRDALAATKGFKGVTGDITFDAERNPAGKPVVILKFHEGNSVYVKIK